jgi:hypothetical protein
MMPRLRALVDLTLVACALTVTIVVVAKVVSDPAPITIVCPSHE